MSADERVEAVVIGGGVIGCAVFRGLAERGIRTVLVESEPSVCEGTSKANSAIVHTGFDSKPGTIESRMLRRAAALWPATLEALEVPFLAVGAVMLALDDEGAGRLGGEIAQTARSLGVEVEVLDRASLHATAPFVTEAAIAGLLIPGEAVIDPFWLTRRYAEAGIAAGGEVRTMAPVRGLEFESRAVSVHLGDGARLVADQVLNCAGLWADEVAGLAGDDSFVLTPRRGEFLVSEETFGVDRIVVPLPGRMGKGMLVTPIVFGGLLLGPTAEDVTDKADWSVRAETHDLILRTCSSMVPAVREMTPIRQFAGLRAVSSTGDYILRPSGRDDRLYHVTGIRSTGISSSPAVAEFVVEQIVGVRGWQRRTTRSAALPEVVLDDDAGVVACPCRSVSVGEVRRVLGGALPATTMDAVKRACGATFGDCQGNLCTLAVAAEIAGATDRSVGEIVKHRRDSWIVAERVPAVVPSPATVGRPGDTTQAEVAIVGGGLAGIGAALVAIDAGVVPLVIERRARWGGALSAWPDALTDLERDGLARFEAALAERACHGWLGASVSALMPDEAGWQIHVQDGRGAGTEVHARQVILATGGYVRPREHRAIDGPRSSGIATSDFVDAALDAGWLPGRVALVAGVGRAALAAEARMAAHGVAVTRTSDAVLEVIGNGRLEAVRTATGRVEADLLVLADEHLPAAFLVRPLGLVDQRPGLAVPSDARGFTGSLGLWAAGTCRRADVDHAASFADGRSVADAAFGAGEVRA